MGPQLLALTFFAHPPITPGDTDLSAVTRDACALNPYANDVLGRTDKLNTHNVAMGCGLSTESAVGTIGVASSVTWRLFTPIYKHWHYGDHLAQPIGSYADWVEWQTSAAKAWSFAYTQGSLSLHHIGPKGGKDLQQGTHELFGLATRYTWQQQKHFWSLGGSAEAGLLWQAPEVATSHTSVHELRLGMGWSESPLFSEPYLTLRLAGSLPADFQWTSSAVVAWPITGDGKLVPFENRKLAEAPPRMAMSLTLKTPFYVYSAATVSTPYATGDRVRQIVVTPLGLVLDL
jgi:hypothetical protein